MAGESRWPPGVVLRFTCGDPLGPVRMVSVSPLDAGSVADISINMVSPPTSGMYQGQWRMCSPTGQYFGGSIIQHYQMNEWCVRRFTTY